ncbi:Oxidoreductase [Puccinia graminis f. sp. tritici]|uniref:Mitochondrial intermembrane space import and assembly protein 40 n=1 Tax=Puccinia graminis f. sp. tritici TaxID=56615 RepID=A0A5B0SGQ1_PUCGR|nr:Oxidoreductase [Puccinia graminis f. sp. tritici]KAA1076309.1 Oxidoreductase [Puccinia graminis f. sp. tritici]KAA1135644.1 Oxidoreductase [Puccinia graminis f. sp. tritici]
MTRSIITNIRAIPRLLTPLSSPSRQSKLRQPRTYHRLVSSSSSSSTSTSPPPFSTGHHHNPSKNTSSDRAIVLGLLSFTTLLGVGIGTRAKCDRNSRKEAAIETENSSKNASEESPENSEQGAFNPETGEINWDCPCLGGMAHGTCGEQFKAAFSCFVHSEQEPKGVECIERFKEMQDCFREHPDEYGPELTDSDDSTPDDDPPNSPDDIASEDPLQPEGQTEERELAARPLTPPEDVQVQKSQ